MPELLSLYRWYDKNRKDYFTTTHPEWSGTVGDHREPSYELIRVEGTIFSPDNPQPADTVPLYTWYDHNRGDNFTTSHPDWVGREGDKREPGYRFVRHEGYVFDPLRPPPRGSVALYGWYSKRAGDNHTTTDRHWGGTTGCPDREDKWVGNSTYRFVRREGYVIPPVVGFPNQYINVPVFFHFMYDSTDPDTGLPAHTTVSDPHTATIRDFDHVIDVMNSMLNDVAGLDSRRLRIVRVGVRYVDVSTATWENPWDNIEMIIGSERLYGAINCVATRYGGWTTGAWKCRADANALVHELGHTLGLYHLYQGNKEPDKVELLWRDLDPESPTSCYVRGDCVCDTPPDYGFADKEGSLHMVACRRSDTDDTEIAALCAQVGPPCDPSDPIVDARGVCSTTSDGRTLRTYDPSRLGLQEWTPVNVMSYAESDQHLFTYEQFVRMHGYAQWRRGQVVSLPEDELWIMRKLETGPTEPLTDSIPSREDHALSYVRQLSPRFTYTPARILAIQPLTEGVYVTRSVGAALLAFRAEFVTERDPLRGEIVDLLRNGALRFSIEPPSGDPVRLESGDLGRESDTLVVDEIYAPGPLAALRGRPCPGTWRFSLEDSSGSLRVASAQITITAKESD